MEDVASAIALPVDFEESEDTYSFIADVPGLEKGDIKVRLCPGPPLPTAYCCHVLLGFISYAWVASGGHTCLLCLPWSYVG